MIDIIVAELTALFVAKGFSDVKIDIDAPLLNSDMPLDSLDLATLIVALEERTGREPFAAGFRLFRTARELSALFSEGEA